MTSFLTKLSGPPMARTRFSPKIADRSHDPDVWSEFRLPQIGLNNDSTDYLSASGYVIQDTADYLGNWESAPPARRNPGKKESAKTGGFLDLIQASQAAGEEPLNYGDFMEFAEPYGQKAELGSDEPGMGSLEPYCGCSTGQIYNGLHGSTEPYAPHIGTRKAGDKLVKPDYAPKTQYPAEFVDETPNKTYVDHVFNSTEKADLIGRPYVNDAAGHDLSQLFQWKVPSNARRLLVDKDPKYNDTIYTHPLEPGVFVRQHVIENIQSNLPISTAYQNQPIEVSVDEKGDAYFDLLDINERGQGTSSRVEQQAARPEDVYDPRRFGYGDASRYFINEVTGQVDYDYSDVDAVRKGNFFVRSEIDHLPSAAKTGVWSADADADPSAAKDPRNLHVDVDAAWRKSTGDFRLSLQQSYMRKYNTSIGWQRKKYPIRRI